MENDNLMGFKRKIMEIVGDATKVNEILSLFPNKIIMPLFYTGDEVRLKDGDEVRIVKSGWKNGEYIYYFYNEDDDLVYTYEEEFIYE
jgi:uncharacterized protein YodC (DUF2158 family)